MARCRPLGDGRGIALVTAVIILAFATSMGVALVALIYSRVQAITLEADRLKALYLAEAGTAQAFFEIQRGVDVDGDGLGSLPLTQLGEGYYYVQHSFETKSVLSIGIVNDTRRTSYVKYDLVS